MRQTLVFYGWNQQNLIERGFYILKIPCYVSGTVGSQQLPLLSPLARPSQASLLIGPSGGTGAQLSNSCPPAAPGQCVLTSSSSRSVC